MSSRSLMVRQLVIACHGEHLLERGSGGRDKGERPWSRCASSAMQRLASSFRSVRIRHHLGRGTLALAGNVQMRSIRVTLPSAYSHTSCSSSR